MKKTLLRILLLAGAALPLFWSCNLSDEQTQQVFSFGSLRDSLKGCDSAFIVIKDADSLPIDTLFHDRITPATDFQNLSAPHYQGGKVFVDVRAFNRGKPVAHLEFRYSGVSGRVDSIHVLLTRDSYLALDKKAVWVAVGETGTRPGLDIGPANLADKTIAWSSLNPDVFIVEEDHLRGVGQGKGWLLAVLKAEKTVRDSVLIGVYSRGSAADSLRLAEDTVVVTAGGAPVVPGIARPHPAPPVLWASLDTAVAVVDGEGEVRGRGEGLARVVASLVETPAVSDTVIVKVLAHLDVDSVTLARDTLEVFAGGSAADLLPRVWPAAAAPEVSLSAADSSVVSLYGTLVAGLKPGESFVYARSKDNPAKYDSLLVLVLPHEAVDSVEVRPDSVLLYWHGEAKTLQAAQSPSSPHALFTWVSDNPSVASVGFDGTVTAMSPGVASVWLMSRADSTKKDKAIVIVRKDVPVIDAGPDTTVSQGSTVAFHPVVTQEYGSLAEFKYDLDGDGTWDASVDGPKDVSFRYLAPAVYKARFYARDGEGNDTIVIRKVKVVSGIVVQFLTPEDSSFTNQTPIDIKWSADAAVHEEKVPLKPGANEITRWVQDEAGKVFSASITVFLDRDPPARPSVNGPSLPTNDRFPTWTWKGMGGGNGTFRYRLAEEDTNAWRTVKDTFYTAGKALSEGQHVLLVQENDAAGNWSQSGSASARIDTTRPAAPAVTVAPGPATRELRPTWSWPGGAGDQYRYYRFKLDDADLRLGSHDTVAASFRPALALSEGTHTLYVEARDTAGNWSDAGKASVLVDTTPPAVPTIWGTASPTNSLKPVWSWSQGSPAGSGDFRYRLDSSDLSSAAESRTTQFIPGADLGQGTHTLYAQERDAAGNWSATGSFSVTIDLTPPPTPIVIVAPGTPTNNPLPTFHWKKNDGSAGGTFRYHFGNEDFNGAVETQLLSFAPSLPLLPEGLYTLYVQEKSAAGVWSASGHVTVRIDTTRPPKPILNAKEGALTNERRPTWSWNKSEAGRGFFRYQIDVDSTHETDSTHFRPALPLAEGTHTLRLQAGDSAGNWSDQGSVNIVIDITPPSAPVVSGPAAPTSNPKPTWTWAHAAGGDSTFRFSLDDSTLASPTPTALFAYMPPTNLSEGLHTLYVQEQDHAGNWSASGSFKIQVDKTPPAAPVIDAIQPRSPLNTLRPTWNWTSGGGGVGLYQVKLNSNDFTSPTATVHGTSYTATSDLAQGYNTLWVRERDSAQNWSAATSRRLFLAPRDTLEKPGFTTGGGAQVKLAISKTGIIYLATLIDYKLSVQRYDAATDTWHEAGTGLREGTGLGNFDLELDPNDVPYLAYGQNMSKMGVMKLVGPRWAILSDTDIFSAPRGYDFHLAFGADATPYLAWADDNRVSESGYGELSVAKFDGIQWIYITDQGAGQNPFDIKIAMGPGDRPYVCYYDYEDRGIRVMTPGATPADPWVPVGQRTITMDEPDNLHISRSASGQMYLGITDWIHKSVWTSNGGDWTQIYEGQYVADVDLALGPDGTPFFAAQENPGGNQVSILAYIDNQWVPVGANLESTSAMGWPSLAVSPDGVPYLGYYDLAAGGKPTVIRTSFDP